MSKVIDRSYQREGVNKVKAELSKLKRQGRPTSVIYQEPTGTGKSHIATTIIKDIQSNNASCLFIVSGREVVKDFSRRLDKDDVNHNVMMSGNSYFAVGGTSICSFHTLQSWAFKNNKIDVPGADVVIIDECRLSCSPAFSDIVKHYVSKGSWLIGLDATPKAKGIGLVWESIVQGKSINWHIDNGSLCPIEHYGPGSNDIQHVKLLRAAQKNPETGEITDTEGERIFNNKIVIGNVYDNWINICKNNDGSMRKTAIFNHNQNHAWEVYKHFKSKGAKCAYIDADTPSDERDDIGNALEADELDAIINISVLSYGVDYPCLETVIANCSIRSVPRYLQIAGRAMRPFEGKKFCQFIDHGCAISDLGFVNQDWQWELNDISPAYVLNSRKYRENLPKEITCYKCSFVFAGLRNCPKCGHKMIAKSTPIPVYVYSATLDKVTKAQEKKNQEASPKHKLKFISECKGYAMTKIHKRQWNYKRMYSFLKGIYKKKYGVWPKHYQLDVDPAPPTIKTSKYIKGYWIWITARMKSNK